MWLHVSCIQCDVSIVVLHFNPQLLFLSQSRSIGDAVYEIHWYELSTNECQILLLIIVRSQKQLRITAGKVMDLTLESFTTVRF